MDDETPKPGMGKTLAAMVAAPISSFIVETADQYLPHPLPQSSHDGIICIIILLAMLVTPHDVVNRVTGKTSQ